MLRPHKISSDHEALFLARYERLLAWALQLTEHDRELAEDLLHDAFIQFTLSRADVHSIHNLDNYLYGVLRHLHLSQVRRSARSRFQQLSIVDYESAETGLRSVDPRAQIQAQDELRRVCHYACARKEKSKAGSVLILRFFHGYYPSEITRILRGTRHAVDLRLRQARAEARASLADRPSLGFVGGDTIPKVLPTGFARQTDDFLLELRRTIFRSRRGDCIPGDDLKALYGADGTAPMTCESLAHVVSCPPCLDEVNKLLGLPLLSERYPVDTIGNDPRSKGGGGDGGGGTAGGGAGRRSLRRWKRGARETFEHKPQELCISVNGYIQGSQRVSSEVSEQSLTVDTPEKISFVEVFSEQGVRLLLMPVDEPPPEGPGEQRLRVRLSDTRSLELALRYTNPWPTLHVLYTDPALGGEAAAQTDGVEEARAIPAAEVKREREGASEPFKRALRRVRRSLAGWRFWLRPGAVTAVFAVMLIAVVLFVELLGPVPVVSAAELLRKSAGAEEAEARRTDQVLHRTLQLEERQVDCGLGPADCGLKATDSPPTGKLISRRRIEVWHSAERGVTARRLYDEQGQLIAGDWRRADGVQTIYQHGSRPQLQLRDPQSAIRNREVWQLDLSAKGFTAFVGSTEKARVEERPATYVISYEKGGPGAGGRGPELVKAALTLSRADLHASELTLLVQVEEADPQSAGPDPQLREYKFTESAFERRAPSAVAPNVFEPDPEFFVPARESAGPTVNPAKKESADTVVTLPAPVSAPVVATAELEVEALRLLNEAGADLDDQTSVARTPEGRLRIGGVVESEERKAEILRALMPLKNYPAVLVEVETVAEALSRRKQSQTPPAATTVRRVEVTRAEFPVYEDLRGYFGKEGAQTDQEIRRFAAGVLNRSRQAMSRAGTLKRLAGQFSPEDLRTLSPEARAKWLGVIRAHARSLEQETHALRQELRPVFFPAAPPGNAPDGAEITDETELARAAERLFNAVSANDRVIRSAFAVSNETAATTALKTPQFWRSLLSAERMAAKIQNAATSDK